MKKIYVHKNEFCTFEENGPEVSITYGYNNGFAVIERFEVKIMLLRKYALRQRMKDYKKRGFRKAKKDFIPKTSECIYLEDYQLPEKRYCENTETNHFFEVGFDSDYLYIREGRIDGLGTINKHRLESGEKNQAAVNRRDNLINKKLSQGYVERYFGACYSLRVIAAEYKAKQKSGDTSE